MVEDIGVCLESGVQSCLVEEVSTPPAAAAGDCRIVTAGATPWDSEGANQLYHSVFESKRGWLTKTQKETQQVFL